MSNLVAFDIRGRLWYCVSGDLSLGDRFTIHGRDYIVLREAQAESLKRVLASRGDDAARPEEVYYDHLNGNAAVQFPDIYIGIEEDGYAHS